MVGRVLTLALLVMGIAWGGAHMTLRWEGVTGGIDHPAEAATDSPASGGMANAIRIDPSYGGHYFLEAAVNGTPVRFLVDSGATHIVLSQVDARRAGFAMRNLRYTRPVATANGPIKLAPVRIRDFRVGQFQLASIEAMVNPTATNVSLLGMTFLNRLHSWEVKHGRLQLYW